MGKHYPFHDRPDPGSWFNQKRRGIKLPYEQYFSQSSLLWRYSGGEVDDHIRVIGLEDAAFEPDRVPEFVPAARTHGQREGM